MAAAMAALPPIWPTHMADRGWDVTGVDPSAEGIAQANRAYPDIRLEQGSAYDDLAEKYGRFRS